MIVEVDTEQGPFRMGPACLSSGRRHDASAHTGRVLHGPHATEGVDHALSPERALLCVSLQPAG
jgi:hypothetical protein